jgi:hypothetical protein
MHDVDDPAMKQFLSRARRGWSPSAADMDRVRLAVEAGLAAGISSSPAPAPAAVPAWAARVLLTAAFTAAGAGGGYWAGRRAERRESAPSRAPMASTEAVSVARPVPVSAPPLEAPAPAPVSAPAPHRIQRSRPVSAPPSPRAPAESLGEEVRALRNVERALRDHNAGLALAFLDDLDTTLPGGQMREERAALRAIARCMGGTQPFGVDLAAEFITAYPTSAYRVRVEQACRGTDSKSAGD